MKAFPRKIWTYWHQGFEDAPYVVKVCLSQLKKLNPDWEIHLLDKDNIIDYVEPLPINSEKLSKLSLPHRSDLLRTQLLIKYGGVWSDPTVFSNIPFDEWLMDLSGSGVFLFHRPGRDRIISNWFIASSPQNPLLIKVFNHLCNYWNNNDFRNFKRRKTKLEVQLNRIINRNLVAPLLWNTFLFKKVLKLFPYMIYHYSVYYLILFDSESKKVWNATPKVSALEPHILKHYGLLKPVNPKIKSIIDEKKIPLFKLDWKINPKGDATDGNTVLDYLVNSNS